MSYCPSTVIHSLSDCLLAKGWQLVTAESCTGGEMAARLTDLPGSSRWFSGGFVTYSNLAKQQMLAVPSATLTQFGAVSEQTVRAMAHGARAVSGADVSIAISGIAGPDGGTVSRPVGTVWFAWEVATTCRVDCQQWHGDRIQIRQHAVLHALTSVLTLL